MFVRARLCVCVRVCVCACVSTSYPKERSRANQGVRSSKLLTVVCVRACAHAHSCVFVRVCEGIIKRSDRVGGRARVCAHVSPDSDAGSRGAVRREIIRRGRGQGLVQRGQV